MAIEVKGNRVYPHTVGIIESEPTRLNLLNLVVRRAGFRTITGANGKGALNIMGRHFIDLILLGDDSSETKFPNLVTRIKKASPSLVMVLGSDNSEERALQLYDAGADFFLHPREFTGQILVARMRSVLRRVDIATGNLRPYPRITNGDTN